MQVFKPTSAVAPSARRSCIAAATRRVAPAARVVRQQPAQMQTRSAEVDASLEVQAQAEFEEMEERGPRRFEQDKPEFKHFLPLPKPAHLVYIKPTVAVVAGMASRSSVGLKMTAGDNQLERYVIEFYSRAL